MKIVAVEGKKREMLGGPAEGGPAEGELSKARLRNEAWLSLCANRESAIYRHASVKTVLRENQLKYVDVEGMRVVTNIRCIAEPIKNDKAENVVMEGSRVGES